MTNNPDGLSDARALALKHALPGIYDGISTFATQRGDADSKPYMLALLEALATVRESKSSMLPQTRAQDLADAKAWLCARWHQDHPNEQHIMQLADYAAHLRATPPASDAAVPAGEVRRNPDDPDWDNCPACKTGSLDTGYECNSCGFDAQPLVHLQDACEARGERMHPSELYESEIASPVRISAAPKVVSENDAGLRDALRSEFREASRGTGRAGTAEMRDGPYMSMDDAAGVYADLMLGRAVSDVGEVFDLDGIKRLWRTGVETGRILQQADAPKVASDTGAGLREAFTREFRTASRGYGRAGTAEMRDGPYMSMDEAAGVYADLLLGKVGLLREARWYVNDALEAHEHSDGRDLLNRIDAALATPTDATDGAAGGGEVQGTFACPICGDDKPHHHTPAVVDAYQTKGSRK
jgi:hypothetical protein